MFGTKSSPPTSRGPSLRTSSEKPGHTSHSEGADEGTSGLYPATTAGELHREMSIRTIFMLGIGGGIGTALFVSIGGALNTAGPANLLLGFLVYSMVLANINNSMAEMTTYMPISGSFIRLAGHWVDDALGFAGGWNFYVYLGLIIPFEITALSLVLSYWSPHIPVAAICAACIVLYMWVPGPRCRRLEIANSYFAPSAINVFAVRIPSQTPSTKAFWKGFWATGVNSCDLKGVELNDSYKLIVVSNLDNMFYYHSGKRRTYSPDHRR
ncbi:amino acid transporter, putative [Cordyceps militaris CM01]|uniref:Amino acid transporter, putative n=1 Tax=Cordyceps militaris (strain CM01) TaxID=983644 RepID=G3J7H5_CORMM|nr:amino acid transporter, putative [Cordyceps militaris CM01]EGX97141.1 amino acid transporter, putative [Cordyceps militaris CM01]